MSYGNVNNRMRSGGVRDPRVNKALDDDLQPLGTGNPKTLFYTITA